MRDNYVTAGTALRTMFVGQLVIIAGAVLGSMAGIEGTVVSPLGSMAGIAGTVVSLLGGGLVFYGIFSARDVHVGYRWALFAQAASLLCNLAGSMLPETQKVALAVLSVIITVADPVALYFICSTSAKLLSQQGENALADRGNLIWKIVLAYFVVDLASVAMSWAGGLLDTYVTLAVLLANLGRVVAYVMMVVFYYSASKALLK